MIIKGLFRRYERWNPVHPTTGAFWGMGVGIGCGVGWGPGFGPEVIGFVGAGCGVGFSVGLTLAGVGVGLPADSLVRMAHGAFEISSSAWGSARSTAIPIVDNINARWISIAPHAPSFKRKAYEYLSSVDANFNMIKSFEFTEMRKMFINQSQSALSQVEAFKKQLLQGKGRMK